MTAQEFARVVKMLRAYWEHTPLSPEGVKAYGKELERHDFQTATALIQAMAREGREHRPPPGVLTHKLAELELDAPTWAEAHKALYRVTARGYGGTYGLPQGSTMFVDMHPVLQAFCRATGARQVYESMGEGGGGEARLRQKYEWFVKDSVEQRALIGIDAPPALKRIERANQSTALRPVAGAIEGVVASLGPAPDDG